MISLNFYQQDCVSLAQSLIGCELVHCDRAGVLTAGLIVETEAYCHDDPASHSFCGLTQRNAAMFGPSGHAYIYQIYGIHWCFNIVAGHRGDAVLIRALAPTQGIAAMHYRRQTNDLYNLCSGPAKLVQAMGIEASMNGCYVGTPHLHITPRSSVPVLLSGPRIGIRQAVDKAWRFWIAHDPFITKHAFNRRSIPLLI